MGYISKRIAGVRYMLHEGGYTHSQAKHRAAQLRKKQGAGVRIAPYEGEWAVWLLLRRG